MPYTGAYPWQMLSKLAGLTLSYRLPAAYDPRMLQEDATRVLRHFGAAQHFRTDHHDGGWEAIGLIAGSGDPLDLRAHRARESYQKTAAMKHAPYIEDLLDRLPCEKYRVRLMRLAAGKNIFWHFDSGDNMDGRRARLHIPVVTNFHVEFQISHESLRWGAGEFWYGDFSFPHRLRNNGTEDRIHLVADLKIDDFLRQTIPPGMAAQARRRKRIRRWAQQLCDRYTEYAPYMPSRFRKGIGQLATG